MSRPTPPCGCTLAAVICAAAGWLVIGGLVWIALQIWAALNGF